LRAAIAAALADVDVLADFHASAEYRRRAATALMVHAIADAVQSARLPAGGSNAR
jgi:CO/xanthine dehydrogenase FAD-binding subunit